MGGAHTGLASSSTLGRTARPTRSAGAAPAAKAGCPSRSGGPGRTALLACGTALLATATLAAAGGQAAVRKRPEGPVRAAEFGGRERYLTHVSTDKPVYRPGEYVRVRGVILRARDRRPLAPSVVAEAAFEIAGPRGAKAGAGSVRSEASVLGFSWRVPDDPPGGRYTVKLSYEAGAYAPAERAFRVYPYRSPRLRTRIDFLRKGYGPGDRVAAALHVERAEGGFPVGVGVTAVARVDGAEVARVRASVDRKGDCVVLFDLPREMDRGEGTLAFTVEDGGSVETAAKTIPILLQKVDITAYPEGGDLVAGLPARVYLEARTPAGKPADVAGAVVDGRGADIARFRTEHEGRGRVSFTPRRGGRYRLRIDEPSGVAKPHPLPEVKPAGAVLRAVEDATPRGAPVRLLVGATAARTLRVTLSAREARVASTTAFVRPPRLARIELKPPSDVAGVLVATVWDKQGRIPLAERLVFRGPANPLRIMVTCDRDSYLPGGEARVRVRTVDGKGRPVGAVVGLAATDASALEMIDPRERAPRLPAMAFLESEVRELADANVYLDPTNVSAPRSLDLLLGTQGWRRFAFVSPAEFVASHGDAARRVLALRDYEKDESSDDDEGTFVVVGLPGSVGLVKSKPAASPGALPTGARSGGVAVLGGQASGQAAAGAGLILSGPKDGDKEPLVLGALTEPEEPVEPTGSDGPEGAAPTRAGSRGRSGAGPRHEKPVLVRVYAHRAREGRGDGERTDFTETVYWSAALRTDPRTGEAAVSFALSDAVTTFRVLADGFTPCGALGCGNGEARSVKPFSCEWKLPARLAPGDKVQVPVTVVNRTSEGLEGASIRATARGGRVASLPEPFCVAAGARVRRLVDLCVGGDADELGLALSARAGGHGEELKSSLAVKPVCYPVEASSGGVIGPGRPVTMRVTVSEDAVPSSACVSAALYPTPMASLTESVERLSREPSGCFAQVSSQIYLTVMAQRYFETHRGVDAALVKRGRGFVERGFARLAGFRATGGGYEWFGGGRGNEALTAYGLMLFTDVAKLGVRSGDAARGSRTWLLSRRDGRGGFSGRERGDGGHGRAPRSTADAYVTWALLEAGTKGLDREIGAVKRAARRTEDSYVLALAANVLLGSGDRLGAREVMRRLAGRQEKEGCVGGAVTSITGSGGRSLRVETTALAILAWLSDPDFVAHVRKGMKFLTGSCSRGYYGSTQATVMALRAIIAHDAHEARARQTGSVRLLVDGEPCGDEARFDAERRGSVEVPGATGNLAPGPHEIALEMTGGSPMPCSLKVSYLGGTPPSPDGRALGLEVSLARRELVEGEVTAARVVVTNLTGKPVPMPVAVIGLPAGLEPRHDRLEELVAAGRVDACEVRGGDVVLYWRGMDPLARKELTIDLVAAVPGAFAAPASRAYPYYEDELKAWAPGARVVVLPRERPR